MDSAALQHSPTPALPPTNTTTAASNHINNDNSSSSSNHHQHSTSRIRAYTAVPNSKTVDPRGAIQKRGNSRSRTISASQTDHLFRLVAEQQQQQQQQQPQHIHSPEAHHAHLPSSNVGIQWLTPQHSPVPSVLSADASIEPFPSSWTVPTPPRSDSGIPTVSLDVNEDPVVTTALCTSAEFTEFEHPTASAEMRLVLTHALHMHSHRRFKLTDYSSSLGGSSLGFLLPSTYGPGVYDTDPNSYPMDQNYMPPMRMSQAAVTSGAAAYAPTATSSPAMYQSSAPRRPDMPSSTHSYGRVAGSPYDSPVSNYSVAPGQTIPSISGLTHSPLPSPPMSSSGTPMMPQYSATSMPRSPNMYDQSVYGQPFTSAPSGPQMYAPVQGMPPYPPQYVGNGVNDMMAKPVGGDGSIRVLNQRPKPQCWDHGCNGRQFSTFSNLLRHQREKSGTSTKSYCPKCGAEFTRTTARNGHLAHDKCTKNRRQTESK